MQYNVIGLMSGSSLDGLDIAYCTITEVGGQWTYSIDFAECVPFDAPLQACLKNITATDVITFVKTHTAVGKWMGNQINNFIDKHQLHHKVHLIGSHGHTAFHFPAQQTSVQIGCGAAIASNTGINVVSDLRAMDVSLGGNGAPIVPIAEKLLFADYQLFLNIGGISNISFGNKDTYIAFDICAANRVLNELALQINKPYDHDGLEAASGQILQDVLLQLNELDYYKLSYPKSLANEMGTEIILPILNNTTASIQDKLRTMTEHIAMQIAVQIQLLNSAKSPLKLLVTGGGAFNKFLIKILQEKIADCNVQIELPEKNVIEYKEALAMALIAVLRWREETNVMATVTGSSRDSIGGALWMGNQ
jgi:anhydro-N-acetylmuramic acid kinase